MYRLSLSEKSTTSRPSVANFFRKIFKRREPRNPNQVEKNAETVKPPPAKKTKVITKCKKEDNNVLVLTLGSLQDAPNVMTGDPCECDNCGAVLSHISKIDDGQKENITWKW